MANPVTAKLGYAKGASKQARKQASNLNRTGSHPPQRRFRSCCGHRLVRIIITHITVVIIIIIMLFTLVIAMHTVVAMIIVLTTVVVMMIVLTTVMVMIYDDMIIPSSLV